MVVGPTTGSILSVADISAYLVADGANVFALEQKRPVITGSAEINFNLKNDFSPGVSIAGVADIMVLAVRRLTGSAQTVYGSLTWHESQ